MFDVDAEESAGEGALLYTEFDVQSYAKELLEKGRSVGEELTELAGRAAALDRQLRKQISAHREQLLTQATSIDSLEDILESLTRHVVSLRLSSDRALGKANELFNKTQMQTSQLMRMDETCNLVRSLTRVGQLVDRLNSGPTQKDVVKSSQILQEVLELLEENDLRGIDVIEGKLALVPKLKGSFKLETRALLAEGLSCHNHALVSSALLAFSNLNCLESEIGAVIRNDKTAIGELAVNLGQGAPEMKERSPTPAAGDARLGGVVRSAKRAQPPSSVAVHANLWPDVQKLAEALVAATSHFDVIAVVLQRRRRPQQQSGDSASLFEKYETFWLDVACVVGESLCQLKGVAQQTLENEYPKLLRLLSVPLARVAVASDSGLFRTCDAAKTLRRALISLETGYLSKSLSRLFDTVNLSFGEQKPPTNDEIDRIGSYMATEIQVSLFDQQLLQQEVANIAKTAKLFAVKSEQLLSTGGEASQVIGNPSPGQKLNVAVVNSIDRFRALLSGLLDDLMKNSATIDVEAVVEAILQLSTLMSSAVQPLIQSIGDAVGAIVETMHLEDFSATTEVGSVEEQQNQCSLYMRELQSFVGRVWTDYLSAFECKDFVYELSTEVASRTANLFLLHSSLVRPLGDGGRLRLAADFAQVEFAISPLCRKLADDLGKVYCTLRAVRPLLFEAPAGVAAHESVGKQVPYWLAVHLIIACSPSELKSAHESVGWSVARYAQWFEEHEDEVERLQFLKGAVESYARSVASEGRSRYCDTYPALLSLLKSGFVTLAEQKK